MKKIKLTIPATSANLGAGFDCLALSLNLYNTFTAEQNLDHFKIKNQGYQSSDIKNPNENLVVKSYLATCKKHNWKSPCLKIDIVAKIPLEAGLGSSATAVVAGVAFAYAFNDKIMDKNSMLDDAYQIESHPDNIAAAIFGGFTVALCNAGKCYINKFLIQDEVKFLIIKPQSKVNTEVSRTKLPTKVSLQKAADNTANSSLFTAAMASYDYKMLKNCMQDNFHQPYRIDKNFQYNDLAKKLATQNDFYGMALSGSGPAFIIICAQFSEEIKKTVKQHFKKNSIKFNELELSANNSGFKYQLLV